MEPNKSNIIIYQTEDGQTRIEVRMEEETVWLSPTVTIRSLSNFENPRTNVVEHIKHIYEERESDEISTCRKFRQVRMQGAGNVSHNQAMDKATQEYHKFEVRTLSPVE